MVFSTDQQFVSIANQPILIDVDAEMYRFLDAWLTPEMIHDAFNTRERRCSDYSRIEGSAYQPFLPKLPDLKINQYQIPTGCSRYSRGLFLVDKDAMARIAWYAFNNNSPNANEIPIDSLVARFPELYFDNNYAMRINWGSAQAPVTLQYTSNYAAFDSVYCLRPIRVPYFSRDAWLLPVVDYRYFFDDFSPEIFKPIKHYEKQVTWVDFFNRFFNPNFPNIFDGFSYARSRLPQNIAYVEELGIPDRSIINGRKDYSVMLDAAFCTVGYRYVPGYGPMSAAQSFKLRGYQVNSNAMAELCIAGGLSGMCDIPAKVSITCRKSRDWFNGYDWYRESKDSGGVPPFWNNDAKDAFPSAWAYTAFTPFGGKDTRINSLWTVNVPTSSGSSVDTTRNFEIFARFWTNACWLPWLQESLDITYAGIPRPISSFNDPTASDPDLEFATFLTGLDNWAIVDLGFGPEGQNKFTTRVQSMPNTWFPKFLIAQDPQDMTHYGPAFFISKENVPVAKKEGDVWKLGKKRGYFMVLQPFEKLETPGEDPETPGPEDAGSDWALKKTEVYANVHNTLSSTEAKKDWPMQAKFINGIWCIDVADCP